MDNDTLMIKLVTFGDNDSSPLNNVNKRSSKNITSNLIKEKIRKYQMQRNRSQSIGKTSVTLIN